MTRSLLFLAPLAFLVGACSSPQSSLNQNTQPVPALANGTVETRWGALPTYSGDKASPIILNPLKIPNLRPEYKVDVDLLVERDGTVSEVYLRNSSGFPEVDKAVAAQFKEARSRLVLAPSDPAPYVLRYALARTVAMADDTTSGIPLSSPNDYRFVNDRPMGTGQPVAGDHPYRN